MRAISWTLTCILLLAASYTASADDVVRVTTLRCEYQNNPIGIGETSPRLSWQIASKRRGCKQTAYRILVSQDKNSLSDDIGNEWDSGKVVSDRSIQIPYAGQPLTSEALYFWKVQVWDETDKPSDWSDVATWTCGLLNESDWVAQWIRQPATAHVPITFDGAEWIWHDEPSWRSQENTQTPPNAPGGETCYLQRSFEIPRDRTITNAKFIMIVDNEGEVWLNGQHVFKSKTWLTTTVQDVTGLLVPGLNLLSAEAKNLTEYANPAGFMAKLIVTFNDGSTIQIATDDKWTSSDRIPHNEWQNQTMAGWSRTVSVAKWGDKPWGSNVNIRERQVLPIFRKSFEVRKGIRRALVHVSGLGHYELSLNGSKIGNQFLDPAWSVYEKTVYYNTLDITSELKTGKNAFGVMLGKGFYDTAGDRRIHFVDVSRPLKLILQCQIQYTDGTVEHIGTDDTWRVAAGPITHSAILGGSDYDARRLPSLWNTDAFSDRSWLKAEITKGPGGCLRASEMPPMVNAASFDPVGIEEVEPGVFVYDFGQNSSARPQLVVQGNAGRTIRLTPAEQRFSQTDRTNDGTGRVNQAGVGSPNYWEYTLRGNQEESWCPQFTYSGFQYLELTGGVPVGNPNPDNLPVVKTLQSIHVRNASMDAGSFECSHQLFNDIDRLIDWAVCSNMAHVLTDCPHREKLGWLEVSYLMGPSIASRYDISRFYAKITRDIRESQDADGRIYTVAPRYPRFPGAAFEYTPEWGAAGVFLPWQLYERYGDRRVLEQNYAAMKAFVNYIRDTSDDLIAHPGLGDWYDYGHGKAAGPSQFTPPELTATAIFYYCTKIVAETAKVLDKPSDFETYSQMAGKTKEKFKITFFDGQGEFKNNGSPQTANAMSLVAGLVPKHHRQSVIDSIVADLKKRNFQQTAGDVGFHFLVEALARNRRSDVLFQITDRDTVGSYGFIVDHAWTSMPEAWDVNTSASLNHLMLGHIQQWFYQDLLGIQNGPSSIAYKTIVIHPQLVGDLRWARGHYDSMYGRINVDWKRDETGYTLNVTIPANAQATVFLPTTDISKVKENDASVNQVDGVKLAGRYKDEIALAVAAGEYSFTIPKRD